jgi:hypothetical protein
MAMFSTSATWFVPSLSDLLLTTTASALPFQYPARAVARLLQQSFGRTRRIRHLFENGRRQSSGSSVTQLPGSSYRRHVMLSSISSMSSCASGAQRSECLRPRSWCWSRSSSFGPGGVDRQDHACNLAEGPVGGPSRIRLVPRRNAHRLGIDSRRAPPMSFQGQAMHRTGC